MTQRTRLTPFWTFTFPISLVTLIELDLFRPSSVEIDDRRCDSMAWIVKFKNWVQILEIEIRKGLAYHSRSYAVKKVQYSNDFYLQGTDRMDMGLPKRQSSAVLMHHQTSGTRSFDSLMPDQEKRKKVL